MKDKKKLLIIIGSIVLVLALAIGSYFIFFNGDNETKKESTNNDDVTAKIDAPASNTEELLEEMEEVEVTNVTKDEIVFSDDVDLKENEKVAVWIYSEPKFLGYFEVLVEKGVKKIVGLKEALENISIDAGDHNIAITKESGEPVGYIDVKIEKSGSLKESTNKKEDLKEEKEEDKKEKTTTKEVVETVEINYETTTQKEVNMKKGTTKVVQEGKKGEKKVTYKVTYDSEGKEISREVKSEKVTKQPVNAVVKTGTSDYNVNSDYITGNAIGFMCTEADSLTNPDGAKGCDDAKQLKSFSSTEINDTPYLVEVDGVSITPIVMREYSGMTRTATYQGTFYYFDVRGGDGARELLTMEICNRYGLSCGSW